MLEELRLNPRSPRARSHGRRPGESGLAGFTTVGPSLSTGFADVARRRSTGRPGPIHSLRLGMKRGVG
jgi:hypothetical protein